jgi:hypothetical protein
MHLRRRRHSLLAGLAVLALCSGVGCSGGNANAAPADEVQAPGPPAVALPNKTGTYKFAVLGDFGVNSKQQYELAQQMEKLHETFGFTHVVLVGDNLYGSERPQDFVTKFEQPYKPLLDAGVKFMAALGNHDAREQKFYKLFNMGGQLYYTWQPQAEVRFFMLESTYPVPEQIKWFEDELKKSGSAWKIAVFHHPLYSSGETHGSDTSLRDVIEPLLLKYNVSLVLNGHDHFYERIKPQKGIQYFVIGSGGQLRKGNIDRSSGLTEKGYDVDLAFMAAEIDGDQMYFNAISRTGQTIDSGVITRRK